MKKLGTGLATYYLQVHADDPQEHTEQHEYDRHRASTDRLLHRSDVVRRQHGHDGAHDQCCSGVRQTLAQGQMHRLLRAELFEPCFLDVSTWYGAPCAAQAWLVGQEGLHVAQRLLGGALALVDPVFGFFICFWVGDLDALQDPGCDLFILFWRAFVLVVQLRILGTDAGHHEQDGDQQDGDQQKLHSFWFFSRCPSLCPKRRGRLISRLGKSFILSCRPRCFSAHSQQ